MLFTINIFRENGMSISQKRYTSALNLNDIFLSIKYTHIHIYV